MSLGRLVLAWLPVAAWFALLAWAAGRAAAPPAFAVPRGARAAAFAGPLVEAALVTLFGSLWFDSLGHGGWWLLFLLVGALVALARTPRARLVWFLADLARYVAAGALLAWRLG